MPPRFREARWVCDRRVLTLVGSPFVVEDNRFAVEQSCRIAIANDSAELVVVERQKSRALIVRNRSDLLRRAEVDEAPRRRQRRRGSNESPVRVVLVVDRLPAGRGRNTLKPAARPYLESEPSAARTSCRCEDSLNVSDLHPIALVVLNADQVSGMVERPRNPVVLDDEAPIGLVRQHAISTTCSEGS